MRNSLIKHALIIAAGNGLRLKQSASDDTPKPLRKLLGMPILERIILSAKTAGIGSFTIVVGYQAEKIRSYFAARDLGVQIRFVDNPDWKKSNGISALKAAADIGNAPFALLMADHIFDPEALRQCLEDGVCPGEVKLAVDERIHEIDDLPDATKVVSRDGVISLIAKTLPTYNAIDTGMFCCSPILFRVLEKIYAEQGDCSLSAGMQVLAAEGRLKAWTFPPQIYWQDVDTAAAYRIAERKLLRSCMKPTDGVISRNFNRYISLFISKYLMKLGLSANTVTGLVTLVGALSGVMAGKGGYWHFLIGAFLFKLASILDGCDGEMSRLRFASSKLGQWLDTLSDNLTYVFFFIGVMIGVQREGSMALHYSYVAGATAFGVAMFLFLMFTYLLRYTDSGSLVEVQKDVQKSDQFMGSWAQTLARRLGFVVKRDFFALAFLGFAVIGKGYWILYAVMLGSNVGWMVLLNMRRGVFGTESRTIRETSW